MTLRDKIEGLHEVRLTTGTGGVEVLIADTLSRSEVLAAVEEWEAEQRPIPGCGFVAIDGTCGHPAALTPECHQGVVCPAKGGSMLTKEEAEDLTALRERFAGILAGGSGMCKLQAAGMKRLIELERCDVDSSHGPLFQRGLPPLSERLAHPGPWESWESPMDRCIVWFSPDGMGYDIQFHPDKPQGRWSPVSEPHWESTWIRAVDAAKGTT